MPITIIKLVPQCCFCVFTVPHARHGANVDCDHADVQKAHIEIIKTCCTSDKPTSDCVGRADIYPPIMCLRGAAQPGIGLYHNDLCYSGVFFDNQKGDIVLKFIQLVSVILICKIKGSPRLICLLMMVFDSCVLSWFHVRMVSKNWFSCFCFICSVTPEEHEEQAHPSQELTASVFASSTCLLWELLYPQFLQTDKSEV